MRLLDALLNDVILPPLPPEEATLDSEAVFDQNVILKGMLSTAHCIEATNVNDFFLTTYLGSEGAGAQAFFDDLKCLIPPYPVFFIEWEQCPIPDAKRMGILLMAIKSHEAVTTYKKLVGGNVGKVTLDWIINATQDPRCTWIFLGLDFVEFHRQPEHVSPLRGPYTLYTTSVAADGEYLDMRHAKVTTAISREEWMRISTSGLSGFLALALLNCRNIEITRQDAPPKLNKSRVKKGKRPLVSFSTIKVSQKHTPKAVSAPTLSAEGATSRLHSVRGHMKRYRGRGIFGKYAGVWYWGPQLRGSVEEGVVISEHEVKSPSED